MSKAKSKGAKKLASQAAEDSDKAEFYQNELTTPTSPQKSAESKDVQTKIIEMGQMIEKKVNQIEEYKKKKEKEIEELKVNKEVLELKLQKKEKEVEALNNSIATFRKENKHLTARIEVESELDDIHHVRAELVKLRMENSELKNEVKALKTSCHVQGKALANIVEKNEYEKKIQKYKQDAAYAKERNRELEDKLKAKENELK